MARRRRNAAASSGPSTRREKWRRRRRRRRREAAPPPRRLHRGAPGAPRKPTRSKSPSVAGAPPATRLPVPGGAHSARRPPFVAARRPRHQRRRRTLWSHAAGGRHGPAWRTPSAPAKRRGTRSASSACRTRRGRGDGAAAERGAPRAPALSPAARGRPRAGALVTIRISGFHMDGTLPSRTVMRLATLSSLRLPEVLVWSGGVRLVYTEYVATAGSPRPVDASPRLTAVNGEREGYVDAELPRRSPPSCARTTTARSASSSRCWSSGLRRSTTRCSASTRATGAARFGEPAGRRARQGGGTRARGSPRRRRRQQGQEGPSDGGDRYDSNDNIPLRGGASQGGRAWRIQGLVKRGGERCGAQRHPVAGGARKQAHQVRRRAFLPIHPRS